MTILSTFYRSVRVVLVSESQPVMSVSDIQGNIYTRQAQDDSGEFWSCNDQFARSGLLITVTYEDGTSESHVSCEAEDLP